MVDTNFISAPAQGLLTLTTTGGAALNLMAGWLLAVKTKGSGATVWYDIAQTAVSQDVTATAASIVSGLPFILVTPSDGTGQIYVPVNMITRPEAASGGTKLKMSENYRGLSHEGIVVTESVAAIQAAITAALAASSTGGGTFASYTAMGTTQGTAAATSTNFIRITAGAVDTGVVLDTAQGGERRVITNATTTRKFYYPASGENFTGLADNIGMTLQPNEAVTLFCSVATTWDRPENVNVQSVTGVGTVQGGGAINANTDIVLLSASAGNTAGTLAAALPGMKIRVANVGSAVARLFPASGGTINGGAADAVYQIDAASAAVLVCNVAGAWVDETSQINRLAVNFLMSPVPSGNLDIEDPLLGRLMRLGNGGLVMDRGLAVLQATGTATAGGVQADGVQVSSNIFDITVCATLGDSATLTAVSDIVLVRNSGAASAYLYCPSGQSMDGVTDGYVVINPGATVLVAQTVAATRWVSTRIEGDRVASFAAAGILQGTATAIPLNVDYAIVTTATAGVDDGVILPAATVGLKKTVLNQTADIVQLWPFTGGQVLAQGVDTAYALGPNQSVSLECLATGTWVQASNSFMSVNIDMIDEAVSGNGITLSHQVVLSQATLVGQDPVTTAIAVTNVVQATYAAATEGIRLGDRSNWYNIYTNSASGGLVYPPTGGTINGAAVDAAIFLPQGFEAMLVSTNSLDFEARIQFRDIEQGQTLTANAVQTQATGTKVGAKYTIAGTVTTALDAFTLDPRTGVKELVFFNNAGVACSLFPPVGGTIDGAAVDAVFVVPRSCAFLLTTDDGLDYKVFLLPGATQVASADAGSSQATGTPIVGPTVNCTVVTTAGDAYTIQTYTPRVFQIWNKDATESLDLFPPVGGTIDGGAANIAFAIPAGVGFKVYSNDGATWLVQLLDGSAQSATAFATGGQANGTPIVSQAANISVVATAGDSVSLKTYSPRLVFVANNDAAESMDLFPTVGGTINGGAVDAAFAVVAGAKYIVSSIDGLAWLAVANESVMFIPVFTNTGQLTDGQVAETYIFNGGASFVPATGSLSPVAALNSSTVTSINGATRTMTLNVEMFTNATAPTGDYTFGLYPVTAVAGGAGVVTYTLGAVVAGSTALFSAPAASTRSSVASSAFTVPAAGTQYVVGVVSTLAVAAGAHIHFSASLHMQA